jgi:hypothetical protein
LITAAMGILLLRLSILSFVKGELFLGYTRLCKQK